MAVPSMIDPAGWLGKYLEDPEAEQDLSRVIRLFDSTRRRRHQLD